MNDLGDRSDTGGASRRQGGANTPSKVTAAVWPRRTAQRAIVVAGCLLMAYTQLTMSPATIEFARVLGANGLHIGILGGLPTGMLFAQFVAAVVANHLQYRRRLWFCVSLVQRLALVPLAAGPLLFPGVSNLFWIWLLIAATAVNHGLLHFCTPLWLSWMGDYLPRRGLSRYWGIRHLWMQFSAALSLLGAAFLFRGSGTDVRFAYATMIGVGAALGIADLFIFLRIEEPRVRPAPEPRLRQILTAPLRATEFRSFIVYSCFWNFAAMIGAPFISLYLLSRLGLDLFHVLLLWTLSWVGGALLSRAIGQVAERSGNRPVLILCTAFKATNMLALLLIPSGTAAAFWILAPVFMFDAVLNAGIAIASNGFMLKNSPRENRTMYIAAGTALAGIVGGLTSIFAGAALVWLPARHGFQFLFATSLALRLVSVAFACRVREAQSHDTVQVMTQLIGATPLRFLRFPVGLYAAADAARDDPVPDDDVVPLS